MIRIEFTGQAQDVLAEMRTLLDAVGGVPAVEPSWAQPEPEAAPEAEEEAPKPSESNKRMFGQSAPNKARRTKDDMAVDAEIEELAGLLDIDVSQRVQPADELLIELRGLARADEQPFEPKTPKRAITATPENRVGPEDKVEEAEVVEEKAEEKAGGKPASKTTREDLKAAMQEYVAAVGMAEAMERFPSVSGYAKQSEIPDDAAVFDEIIAKLKADAANG